MDICAGCHDELPWNLHACLQCALPLPAEIHAPALCGRCLKQSKAQSCDAVWAAFIYRNEVPWLVTHLKFHARINHARLLGELMWERLQKPLQHQPDITPNLIVPIPLHKSRLRERGFNQALEIARPIARYSAISIDASCLKRTRKTRRQSDLTLAERQHNLRQAFVCKRNLKGLHIVLIDDVMTSGNTLNAAALTLKKAGAARVSAWITARAAFQAI